MASTIPTSLLCCNLPVCAKSAPILALRGPAHVIHVLVNSWLDFCNLLYLGLPLRTCNESDKQQLAVVLDAPQSFHVTLLLHKLLMGFQMQSKVLIEKPCRAEEQTIYGTTLSLVMMAHLMLADWISFGSLPCDSNIWWVLGSMPYLWQPPPFGLISLKFN